ncbi:hypothetical protein SUGI_1197130 [Cryptomeria japonica]|nr:hypothetical protein SUGI_1197130 [Cryptomeria japonica]
MNRKAKTLQFLGALGIVEEAFKIIHSQTRLLVTITLMLILPFHLVTMAHSLMTPFLLANRIIYKQITKERRLPIMQLTELLVLEVIYADFYYGAFMPSMAAAGYTVASFYK